MNITTYVSRLTGQRHYILGDIMLRCSGRHEARTRVLRFEQWGVNADGTRTGVFVFMDGRS